MWGVVIAAFALLLAGAWVGFRLYQAYTHLQAAAQSVQTLSADLKAGTVDQAPESLADLQEHATAAHSAAHDFLWSTAQHLPAIGPNLAAVRSIADTIDTISWRTLPPLVKIAGDLDPDSIAPRDGAIDIEPLIAAKPAVAEAISAIESLRVTIGAIDPQPLLPQVAAAVAELGDKLDYVSDLAATANKAVTLLPPMLGADGPRTYLVAFQNLAEVRATGGIFGAYAVMSADQGRIRLVAQGTASGDIGRFHEPVVTLPDEQRDLYTDAPAIWPQDVNFSPDFPTAARLYREMYQQRFGVAVDGVIATDPVALSQLLRGTGPVTLADGQQLTADNAVDLLLSEAYQQGETPKETNRASDLLFANAASAVFQAMMTGQGSGNEILTGLKDSASQRRLLVWSAEGAEQQILAGTVLGGILPSDDGAEPLVGVFLNDGTMAKMDSYLRESVSLDMVGCIPDGAARLQTSIALTSVAPSSGLSDYTIGTALGMPYVTRTNVLIFLPTGGQLGSATLDGEQVYLAAGTENGRNVAILTVDLQPGETKRLVVGMTSGPLPADGATKLQLRTTPLATPAQESVGPVVACG